MLLWFDICGLLLYSLGDCSRLARLVYWLHHAGIMGQAELMMGQAELIMVISVHDDEPPEIQGVQNRCTGPDA